MPSIDQICDGLHRIFRARGECAFPAQTGDLPMNGIYALFEDGETAHDGPRIVRVGSHTGADNLPARLAEHTTLKKDRSIFRKNIGRALLNKRSDDFLEDWNLDLTKRVMRQKHAGRIDFYKQERVEVEVTAYIVESFRYTVIPIDDAQERLDIEKAIIGTLARCPHCQPSAGWLGLFSPKPEIRRIGLWLSQHLKGAPLDESGLAAIQNDLEEREAR